jgi:hypothetical protein
MITFPRPLDRALLERTLTIKGPQKKAVTGHVTVTDSERQWAFQPDQSWSNGKYEIVVDTVLEDLAGNRIGQAFEVDKLGTVDLQVKAETVVIPFEVR